MGDYNPHAPRIIGQEWVPIRNENLVYSPSVNTVELGTSFVLGQARQARDARFYLNEMQATPQLQQVGLVNIYPKGQEDLTGPISQVIIPIAQVQVTGTDTQLNGGATSVLQALYQPGDGLTFEVDYAASIRSIACWFDINRYGPLLYNKRILNVSMLYAGYLQDQALQSGSTVDAPFVDPDPQTPATVVDQRNDLGSSIVFSSPTWSSNAGGLPGLSQAGNAINADASIAQTIAAFNLGDVNNFWSTAISPNLTDDRMPWRWEDLRRLDPSFPNINRQHILIRAQLPITPWQAANPGDLAPFMVLDYVALRVIYCEEYRIATGGRRFKYNFGANIIPLRDMAGYATDPVIPPGTYTATLSWVNPGNRDFGRATTGDFPKLNALREMYQIPSHIGTQVNVPFPLEDRLGDTFTSTETHILPQLTLHASGGTWLEPHVYGRQAIGQVYGSLTVTQEIQDGLAGASASWPWVRYMARRFGDTTVPLTLAIAGQSVAITPTEFDALDEVLDGWKEVTLRFTTPPTMGSGIQPQAVWSATNELAGNRWEIIGASAPAISGIPGNTMNLVPSPNQLAIATYGQPVSGSIINMGWIPQGVGSPWVSGTADDNTSDAFVIFAQDMPTVTGFTVTTLTQPITGIGQNCDVDPCCIPTGIIYNEISWGIPSGQHSVIVDTFSRVAVSGWGSTDTGELWQNTGGVVTWFSVNGSSGLHTRPAGSFNVNSLNVNITNFDATVEVSAAPPTNSADAALYGRHNLATDEWYRVAFNFVNGSATLNKRVGGVSTVLASSQTAYTSGFSGTMKLRLQLFESKILGKVWPANQPEPVGWTLSAMDIFLTGPGQVSVSSFNSTVAIVDTWDNFRLGSPTFGFGYRELQRMDTVEPEWQTIMTATSPDVTRFNDYEARVGVETSYRIRDVNVYDFPGPWSITVTATIPAPGVSGGCLEGGHVLIFTSNERQSGSINLAYSTAWMGGQVEEDFTFPEAGFVQLQLMYNKDFYTAFRPLERGGERFSRTVLVQAAAIAPETLGDFKSLRDMAWDTVNYICVRDEDGNRWLATVIVPAGRVLRDRRLYLAPVDIIEVTDTPTPVDPYVT